MSRFKLLDLIQKNIDELKWLFEKGPSRLTKIQICRLARGLIGNLEDRLEEYIEANNKKKKPVKKLKNHLCKD